MLREEIERYVKLRRAAGYKFYEQERALLNFAGFAEASGDDRVRAQRAYDWAVNTPSQKLRRGRLGIVRDFVLAMRIENARHELPAADALGSERIRRPTPCILAPEEIDKLIAAAVKMKHAGSFRPLMYATLFGLLAATGMRISEALGLKIEDVTDDGLVIRDTKFRKNRLVPLHTTAREKLENYLSLRRMRGARSNTVFVGRTGKPLSYGAINYVFSKLISSIGLRTPGRRGPVIHSFRHTFAVRSLEECPHDRAAASRHMLALSTYLGHTRIECTYWYLQATPTLLARIAGVAEDMYRRGAS